MKGAHLRTEISTPETYVNRRLISGRQPCQLPLEGKLVSTVSVRGHRGLWDPLPETGATWLDLDWYLALAQCLRDWFRFARGQSSCATKGGAMQAFYESLLRYHINSILFAFKKMAGLPSPINTTWRDIFQDLEQTAILCDREDSIKRRAWEQWIGDKPRWRKRLVQEMDNPNVRFLFLITVKHPVYWHIRQEVFLRLHMRNIFMTESGHLGIGSSELREGDLVVLFPGASSPMVLRVQGDFFRLIGPAVIHGLMPFIVRDETIPRVLFRESWEEVVENPQSVWPVASSVLDTFILV
jgi:hypothetical protein